MSHFMSLILNILNCGGVCVCVCGVDDSGGFLECKAELYDGYIHPLSSQNFPSDFSRILHYFYLIRKWNFSLGTATWHWPNRCPFPLFSHLSFIHLTQDKKKKATSYCHHVCLHVTVSSLGPHGPTGLCAGTVFLRTADNWAGREVVTTGTASPGEKRGWTCPLSQASCGSAPLWHLTYSCLVFQGQCAFVREHFWHLRLLFQSGDKFPGWKLCRRVYMNKCMIVEVASTKYSLLRNKWEFCQSPKWLHIWKDI